MNSKNKTFDCVEMKRQASLKLHEKLSGMTKEERKAFWDGVLKKMIEEQASDRAAFAKAERRESTRKKAKPAVSSGAKR